MPVRPVRSPLGLPVGAAPVPPRPSPPFPSPASSIRLRVEPRPPGRTRGVPVPSGHRQGGGQGL